jgi:hypothetical protein
MACVTELQLLGAETFELYILKYNSRTINNKTADLNARVALSGKLVLVIASTVSLGS